VQVEVPIGTGHVTALDERVELTVDNEALVPLD
jgi:hypothetical protein